MPDDSGDHGDNDRIAAFSQTNPRFWAKLMLSLAPTFVAMSRSESTSPNSFDLSLIPAAQGVTELLSPANVTLSVDDGRSIRIETTSSLPLPTGLGGIDLFLIFYLLVDGF